MDKSRINKALAIACEVIGSELTEAAARLMAAKLAVYPEAWVLGAIDQCIHELRHKLTLSDIIERLADGRPGPEEAWASLPRDEASTCVWTEEMQHAWGVCLPILATDPVQARMAFLESYRKELLSARRQGIATKWQASIGHDISGREGPINEAVRLGRITQHQATQFLPNSLPAIPLIANQIDSLANRMVSRQ